MARVVFLSRVGDEGNLKYVSQKSLDSPIMIGEAIYSTGPTTKTLSQKDIVHPDVLTG
jgi:hypothetical protein